jgi:hypothetical protein
MVSLLRAELRATVYISWGKWVARCPNDGCPNAEHYGADPDTGHVGGLTDTYFHCSHCGLFVQAEWPDLEVAADAVRLLGMRPVPATRSWLPGEPVENLLAENVQHYLLDELDLLPAAWTEGDAITVMEDGRLAPHVRELVTARARAVLAADASRGTQLRADQLLAIGA